MKPDAVNTSTVSYRFPDLRCSDFLTLDLSIISQFLESHISITPRTSDFISYLRG